MEREQAPSGLVERDTGRVLVLNAHAKHALAAIRCLGEHGVAVTAGSSKRWSAGAMSKHTDRIIRHPDPVSSPEEFVRALERELQGRTYDMLLPINTSTVRRVVEHKSRLEADTNVPFLPYDRLQVGLDKEQTIETARQAGIPRPKTRLPDEVDFRNVISELGRPVVVKPVFGSSRTGITVCESREELERVYRETQNRHGRTILQEFIPNGGEVGVYTLYDRASELARVTVQRRIRTNPPAGGASTYRETVANPEVLRIADRLLSALDWQGVAMVEFRIDARDGEPKLMEINPRLWGSLSLSIHAGVDFPYRLYEFATDPPVERDLTYDVGVESRCLFTDFQQVLNRDDRLTAAREFVARSENPCRFDIVSTADPLPTLGQMLYAVEVLSSGNDGSRKGDHP